VAEKKRKRERRKRWAAEAGWAENRGGLRERMAAVRLGRVFFPFSFFFQILLTHLFNTFFFKFKSSHKFSNFLKPHHKQKQPK
jgi:hypothetical protein